MSSECVILLVQLTRNLHWALSPEFLLTFYYADMNHWPHDWIPSPRPTPAEYTHIHTHTLTYTLFPSKARLISPDTKPQSSNGGSAWPAPIWKLSAVQLSGPILSHLISINSGVVCFLMWEQTLLLLRRIPRVQRLSLRRQAQRPAKFLITTESDFRGSSHSRRLSSSPSLALHQASAVCLSARHRLLLEVLPEPWPCG